MEYVQAVTQFQQILDEFETDCLLDSLFECTFSRKVEATWNRIAEKVLVTTNCNAVGNSFHDYDAFRENYCPLGIKPLGMQKYRPRIVLREARTFLVDY